MKVNSKRCKTCPFNKDGDAALREKVMSRVVHKLNASQYCHGTDNTTLCRGARDEQLAKLNHMGLISAPTDKAFEEMSRALGIEPNNQKPGPSYYGVKR